MFQSDGKRTWDAERNIELKRTSASRDIKYFEIFSPDGSLNFTANWRAVPAGDNIPDHDGYQKNYLIWRVFLHDQPIPGYEMKETKNIIQDAFDSYETIHGIDTINRATPLKVICEFFNAETQSWEAINAA